MVETKMVEKTETVSKRFIQTIMDEFAGTVGGKPAAFDEKKKRLAQHLFIKIDAALSELEGKRAYDTKNKNKPAITWNNVNMAKLAIDAMHRIELNLDALVPNHISVIPFLNGKTKKYDIDLRIGYTGKDYYRRKVALDPPVAITYELVYENDVFQVQKKSPTNSNESYVFEIPEPFNRGKIVGGFGYIQYEDPRKNKLVLVSETYFQKTEDKAPSKKFWGPYGEEMRYKTLVLRTTDKIVIDPDKINVSYAKVEEEEKANLLPPGRTPLDITPGLKAIDTDAMADDITDVMTEEEKKEAIEREQAEGQNPEPVTPEQTPFNLDDPGF